MPRKRDYEIFSPERLKSAAALLFYQRGYAVGLQEILDAAGIYKATFYRYYESKEDLAVEYVQAKKAELIEVLQALMQKRPQPEEFFATWAKLLARGAEAGDFYGCPFSNLFAQTLHESPRLRGELRGAVEEIINVMAAFLGDAQRAQTAFTYYEGTMTMYNLTGDKRVFARLAEDMRVMLCKR
ncbi:TetR/AcrR family transcriptional regulator [Turneriella parva]|uniref:Transcriptional regulator, TetR family n=1 Tax=Turneriella parva (strain ATCC BAA-1111 / DSM 21527 / NCTC 11395 / H) TaxID=869212 RepID=I4B2I7_TURPD|nr:TetR/AcrR family transcriptional regulator [Turneriella parva]AFM11494.1 transcriptional regulator, TetR family [Turneriella parva DSM 21527]